MAPALSFPPGEPRNYGLDAVDETDKLLSHRRRALTSVDNLSLSMEEDIMGFQSQDHLVKDNQEIDQILVDLDTSDLGQADILQAIKTLESGGDTLSTCDPDAIFPLSGFDLTDTADSESDAVEEKIKSMQLRLERRCSFLLRRLRLFQAKAVGKRISQEASKTFEACIKGARKDGGGRPMSIKAFLKRIETTSNLQASAASRSVVGPKYYRAGTSKGDAYRSATVGVQSGTLAGLEDTAGALRSHLSVVKKELDSDATISSSDAESNDEAITYSNPHQQHMPIEKRALWSWQRTRASIAVRWSWLQAQVQELEYKIRQHNELHRQVREAKGVCQFDGEPTGYIGPLPGQEKPEDDPSLEGSCARVRPLRRENFKKRKLLRMHDLHKASEKAAKPSDIRCNCQYPIESCPVCTGRAEPNQPTPPLSTLSAQQRLALTTPEYHPVLSDIRDLPPSSHLSALSSCSWFRGRVFKSSRRVLKDPPTTHPPAPTVLRTQQTRSKRGRPPLSRKIKERDREERVPTPAAGKESKERSRGRGSTETRTTRHQSYDIDNIVIPQSIAASTKPEILHYKEIITPKWRVMDLPQYKLNNGDLKSLHLLEESEEEDISEEAVAERHKRAEQTERGRYLSASNARRRVSNASATVPTTPAAALAVPTTPVEITMLPAPALASEDTSSVHDVETVRPYTPRQFPLPEGTYLDMLSDMPEGYRPSSAESSPEMAEMLDDDGSSTISTPMSPLVFDNDDPDDAEWDPDIEKKERRKSTLRMP